MPNINKCLFVGHLGRDPETRYMTNGTAVTSLSIGVTDKWKDKNGEWQEATEWVRVSIFGELGEFVVQKFGKGDAIQVEGKMKTRKWQDKSGQDKYSTEIHAYYVAEPIYAKKGKPEIADDPQGKSYKGGFEEDDVPF